MEFRHLKTFLDLCYTLNFTKTADRLQYAQSSITAQIKSLETEFQLQLFERLGKKIVLTQAGKRFQHYAEQMINLEEETRSSMYNYKDVGTLIIGAQESQCTYRLPQLLYDFKLRFPKVNLIFTSAHSDEHATNCLLDGAIDVAFIMDTERQRSSLISTDLLNEKLLLVSSPNHPLVSKKKILVEELERETILFTEQGCSYRNLFEQLLYEHSIKPRTQLEFISLEAIKKCVMANLGITMLPEMVVSQEIRDKKLVSLNFSETLPLLTTKMAYHKDKWISPELRDFIKMTKTYFHSLSTIS